MAVFTTEHTARKAYRCTRCDGRIKRGQKYTAYAITPDSDLGNTRWIRGRDHLTYKDCENASE